MDEELDIILNRNSGFRCTIIDARSHVRLLRISGGASLTDMQYDLEIADLADLPSTQYRALSYTWGHITGLDDVGVIEIGGASLVIRRNLYDFLRTVVSKNEFGLFFIDTICMNQLDLDERRFQVQEMAHIYRYASEVIA
ncbi:heterokaryon incompatibility protein-domain-containing protein [Camillea tinctor]|nr:heterokaryon incompatibility protein-domain-containing protein [Camillea tinctor]